MKCNLRVISCFMFMLFVVEAGADSLFTEKLADGGTLIASMSYRFKPGDLVTVLVRENIDGSTDSDLDTKKESTLQSTVDPEANPFLAGRGSTGLGIKSLPTWDIESESEHKSDGSTSRKNKLVLTVSCVVLRVHDNGNIVIEGQKAIQVNRESTLLKISGMVRGRDVGVDNTVLSTQIANASIQLTGEGPLWNNQRRGFFTKLLDWFSPN